MKITEVQVFPVHQFVYVKIETDQGIYGIGEASLSGRSLAVVEALGHIKPLLIAQDPTRIEHIWQDIFRGTFWRGGPVLQSALAGIDIALWDLAGKSLAYRLTACWVAQPARRCWSTDTWVVKHQLILSNTRKSCWTKDGVSCAFLPSTL